MDELLVNPEFDDIGPRGQFFTIDFICALLDNWVEQANVSEQSACNARIAIVSGMALFIAGGATSLAAFSLDHLALAFALAMACTAAFLNHVSEKEKKAWRETGRLLSRIQCRIIDEARLGASNLDLQAAIRQETGLGGTDQPKVMTHFDIAKWRRSKFCHRDMDWGSRLFYGFIVLALVVILLENHPMATPSPQAGESTSFGRIEQPLPSPPRPEG
ncbi:MAG: hypothetical protein R3F54_10065 [Alphaproteobacteria bacterium]